MIANSAYAGGGVALGSARAAHLHANTVEEDGMATERLPMRKIKEILRQKWLLGRRHRPIARALEIGVGTVSSVVGRADAAALTWEQVEALPDTELEGRLYAAVAKRVDTPLPDPPQLDVELKKAGVTLAAVPDRCQTRQHRQRKEAVDNLPDHLWMITPATRSGSPSCTEPDTTGRLSRDVGRDIVSRQGSTHDEREAFFRSISPS